MPNRSALSIRNKAPGEKRAAWLDPRPLRAMWGRRLPPGVGPAFKVFKEDVLSQEEEKKKKKTFGGRATSDEETFFLLSGASLTAS